MKYRFWLSILFLANFQQLLASADSTSSEFTLGVELRTRSEFRLGYRTLVPDTSKAAFFTTQRSRLNIGFRKDGLRLKLSLQDIRTWGEKDLNDASATFQMFEGYAAYDFKKHVTLQLGRQQVFYDNERLFARNNWRQSGRAHDAFFVKYEHKDIQAHGGVAFNQMGGEPLTGRDYNAVQDKGINYKFLGLLWFQKAVSEGLSYNSLMALTGYEATNGTQKLMVKVTHGGRLTFVKKGFKGTVHGYYQLGKNIAGQKIRAWYVNPEVEWKSAQKHKIKAGMEWLSGDPIGSNEERSFVPLYGVAHRFNGFMDYFISFPSDTRNAGLINPYISYSLPLPHQLSLQTDIHGFFSQFQPEGMMLSGKKYLGTELDVLLNYDPLAYIHLEAGYSLMLASENMKILKGVNNPTFPQWAYLQITINPTLFKWAK